MNRLLKSLTLLLGMVLLTSCMTNSSNVSTKHMVKSTTSFEVIKNASNYTDYHIDSSVITGSNEAGFELIKHMYTDQSSKNLLLSPISLTYALAMVENGAEGSTKEGVLKTMLIKDENMNTTYNQLLNYYNHYYGSPNKKDDTDPLGSTLKIANSLWLKTTIKPEQAYVDTLKQFYDAQIFSVDFSSKSTINQMNVWVEEQTNHLLKDTLEQLDPSTVACLMNTVYFKGYWKHEFYNGFTEQKSFYMTTDKKVDVSMMQATQNSGYYEDETCQVAALDYNDATMYVILPKENLNDFLQDTSYEAIQAMISKSQDNLTSLVIDFPKFKFQSNNSLNDYLMSTGMKEAFDPEHADFSKMIKIAGENVYISEVFQNATISVDEKGTEAAAVTVITMKETSAEVMTNPIPFNCNKPFLFVIKEKQFNTDLFVGILENPVQ